MMMSAAWEPGSLTIDHRVVDAALARPVARLRVEALGDHAPQGGLPGVAVLV